MSTNKLNMFLCASLKSSVALLPLAIAVAQMPAYAQSKTQAQLEAEAAAARAEAATGADADDAAAIAQLLGGLTGTSTGADTKDIVVTGTQIRGVAPTGTNLTVLSKEDIAATGQVSVGQMLATIPGFSNFLALPNNGGAAAQGGTQTDRPNLRGTPDGNLAAAGLGDPGSSTLILIDGNRQSGGGIRSISTDPDSISPALLERVEINTDGGSAAYGSDAIGGVVNFVTRRRFDGAEVGGRLGYADDYWQYDATALVGKDWGSGSAYISGNYSYNTPLRNRDRTYLSPVTIDTGQLQGVNCDLPNITITGTAASGSGTTFVPANPTHYYRVNADGTIARGGDVFLNGNGPNGTHTTIGTATPVGGLASTFFPAGTPTAATTPNLCDIGQHAYRVNRRRAYGVSGNIFQKITDDIDFLLRGSYNYTGNYNVSSPLTANIPVNANNPWRQELNNGANGAGITTAGVTTFTPATFPTAQPGFPTPVNDVIRGTTPVAQTVQTNLGPVYGYEDNYAHNWAKKFGGNATLTWRIDGNWQLSAVGSYDRTTTKTNYGMSAFSSAASYIGAYYDNGAVCSAAIATYVAAGGNTLANAGNAVALAARAVARQSCINPYNPEASNPVFLAAAHNVDSKSLGHQAIIDIKANLDGALFEIPGGKVRVAVGGEYLREDFEKWQYASQSPVPFSAVHDPFTVAGIATINSVNYAKGFNPSVTQAGNRAIKSVYGEVNIPLVSRANELTWIKELRLSLSGRYDRIDIFGDTFNPKIGASFKPTNWLLIKGNYNTSFRAPTVSLSVAADQNMVTISPVVGGSTSLAGANPPVPDPLVPNQVIWVYNAGARRSLKPTTGNQWSVGFELMPFRGFRATVTYSYINFYDSLISSAPQTASRGTTAALENAGLGSGLPGQGCTESDLVVVLDPRTADCTTAQIAQGANPMTVLTAAQVAAAKAAFAAEAINGADALADGRPVYGLYDGRYRNAGNAKIGTLDYTMNYNSRTPWGSVFFSVSGSYRAINKTQGSALVAFTAGQGTNPNNPSSRHSMTARAGFTYGPLRASAILQHADGYRVNRSANSPQDRVSDFNLINTSATWDFKGDNVVERGLQLSLTINNILNTRPPVRYSNNTVGTANGSTIGRLVQVGFNKKF